MTQTTGYYPGYYEMQPPPPRKKKRGPLGILLRIVLAVALLLGGVFVVGVGKAILDIRNRPELTTPLTAGASPRMTSQFARDLEKEIEDSMPSAHKAQAGVYGRNGQAEYLLVAGYGIEETGRQVLDGFIKEAKGSMTFGRPSAMPGGLSCTTANAEGRRGSICAWAGDTSNGLLWAFGNRDVRGVAKSTVAARAEVEARV